MEVLSKIQLVAVAIIPLILAITVHEAAHGWLANRLGDKTALMLGRITLNPAKHIDPLGTIVIPILMLLFSGFIFGWAKPVPVNWQNLNHPRRDMAWVALAGPGANLIMALFWALVAKLVIVLLSGASGAMPHKLFSFLVDMAQFGIMINVVLMILNLVPIPPLDGSRVVSSVLPPAAAHHYERLEPYGIWILLGLLLTGLLVKLIGPPIYAMLSAIKSSFGI